MPVRWSWKHKLGEIKFNDGKKYFIFAGTNCMFVILMKKETGRPRDLSYYYLDYCQDNQDFKKYVKYLIQVRPPKEWVFTLTNDKVMNTDIANSCKILTLHGQNIKIKRGKYND